VAPQGGGKKEAAARGRGTLAVPAEEDMLDETVIIRPGRAGDLKDKDAGAPADTDMREERTSGQDPADDFLDQTIIQKPDKTKK